MSNAPEVAQSPIGLEVDHSTSMPLTAAYDASQHPYAGHYQPVPSKGEDTPFGEQERTATPNTPTICGVRRPTFWLAVILAIVVIGAAVGGGVGGSLAVANAKDKSDSTATSSPARETVTVTSTAGTVPIPTSTNALYTPLPLRDTPRIDISCPQSLYSSDVDNASLNKLYQYNCQEKKDSPNSDLLWFTAYTLQACINGCSTFNSGNKTNTKCVGVALSDDISHQADRNGGANCWLKMDMNPDGFIDSPSGTVAWLVDA